MIMIELYPFLQQLKSTVPFPRKRHVPTGNTDDVRGVGVECNGLFNVLHEQLHIVSVKIYESEGILLYVGSFVLVYWAMVVNEHFEASARIQADRAHKVITRGPYRVVRHPGYLGMILGGLSGPLTIGSLFSLIPVMPPDSALRFQGT